MRRFFGRAKSVAAMSAILLAALWTGLASGQEQTIKLEVGKELRRELNVSETHGYRVALQSGEFIRVTITQNGVNTSAAIADSAGNSLVEAKSPGERHGANELWFVAESAGDHLIRVSSLTPGSYAITLREQRIATATDRHRHSAQGLSYRAEQLKQKESKADKQRAIELGREAVQHWRQAGDQEMEAFALYRVAAFHNELRDLKPAIEFYNQAIPLFRSRGNKFLLANALCEIGGCLTFSAGRQVAEPPLHEAITLSKELREPRIEATAVNSLGNVYSLAGDLKTSGKYYAEALALARRFGIRKIEASALNNGGNGLMVLGQYEKAEEWFQQGLSIVPTIGDRGLEALLHLNLAHVSAFLGKSETAEQRARQALEISKAIGNRQAESGSNKLLASLYRDSRQYAKSEEFNKQALLIARQMGNRYKEVDILTSLGGVYRLAGKHRQALDTLNESLALARNLKMPFWEYQSLYELASQDAESGELEQAQNRIEEALRIVESLRAGLIVYELRSSFVGTVQGAYQLYLDILMQRHSRNPNADFAAQALQACERGRAQGLVEMLEEAKADIRRGVDPQLLKREDELQSRISAKTEERLALGSNADNQAKAAEVEKALETLKDELGQVETSIRAKSPQYASLAKPKPVSVHELQTKLLDDDTLFLEYSLGEKQSWLWAVTKTSFTSYKLPAGPEIETAARKLYDLLRRPAQTGNPDAVAKAARSLSDLVLKPVAARLRNHKLMIAADGALQYVPFGVLPEPVVAGKSASSTPLVVKHTLMVIPSATTLAVLRQGLPARQPAPKTIAAFADPVFGRYDDRLAEALRRQNDLAPTGPATLEQLERAVRVGESGLLLPRLPFSQSEAEAIAGIAPKDQSLVATGFQATRELAMSERLKEFRFIHFATHGVFNTQRPDLSGLFFSTINEQGDAQKGFLGISEVYGMTLPADLVVLSACDTGLGKQVKGEGLVGMTRGFMYAGARRVVASLWKVNDASTAELMKRFYQGMLGPKKLSPSAALREAQVSMWADKKDKRRQAPYHWAAFVLQGEW